MKTFFTALFCAWVMSWSILLTVLTINLIMSKHVVPNQQAVNLSSLITATYFLSSFCAGYMVWLKRNK